jgi:hypothetical protein
MDQRKNIERVGFCGGNSRSVWRIMHKSLDSSFSRRRPSPEQTFCCWLAECVHKNSTAHTACVSRRWKEREREWPLLHPWLHSLSIHIENASAACAMGFMSILRTHAAVALNILCATAHQDFSLNSIRSTILVFPFFSHSPPSFLYTCACWFFPSSSSWKIQRFSGNLRSIPSACFVLAHTNFFYFLFPRVFLTFLSRLLYLHFPIFFPILLARYANNAMTAALHLMRCRPWKVIFSVSCFNYFLWWPPRGFWIDFDSLIRVSKIVEQRKSEI